VVSKCLGELKCTYNEYCEMTWSEFQLRLFAYNRMQKEEWHRTRFVAYQVYVSNWANSKKKPLSIDKYFSLDETKSKTLNDTQRNAILKAQEQYNNK